MAAFAHLSAANVADAYTAIFRCVEASLPAKYDFVNSWHFWGPSDPRWIALTADAQYEHYLKRLGLDEASVKRVPWESAHSVFGDTVRYQVERWRKAD